MAWVTTFQSGAFTSTDSGWGSYTLRVIIPAADISIGGSQIRITLKADAGYSMVIGKVYVGILSGSYGFASAPVQALFGGSAGTTVAAGASAVTDSCSLTFAETDSLLVAIYFSGTSTIGTIPGPPYNTYYIFGDDASTQSPSGYTSYVLDRAAVFTIEVDVDSVTGSAAITEASDTIVSAGSLGTIITGSAAITEASDTISSAGRVFIAGAAAITEAADTVSSTGGGAIIIGTAAITEAPDTISSAGTVTGDVVSENSTVSIWGRFLQFGRKPESGEILVGNTTGAFTLIPAGISNPSGVLTFDGPITAGGVITSTAGGFKFPDNSVQTTAATGGPSLPLDVANGGTGLGTLTDKNIIIGAGTSDVTFLAPGTSGNVAVSNGTDWTSGSPYPTQTSNNRKVIATNGTTASWQPFGVHSYGIITDGTSATCTVGTGSVNIDSVTMASGVYTVTFTSAMASANYAVTVSVTDPGTQADRVQNRIGSKTTTSFTITTYDISGNTNTAVAAFDFMVVGGF